MGDFLKGLRPSGHDGEESVFRTIALVLPCIQRSREDVMFTSNVIGNRGPWTREFENIEEARMWLLDGT